MEQAELRLKETIFSLFEPDVLLPVQYFDLLTRKAPIEPEIRLMWAVLEDAVGRYRRYCADPDSKSKGEFGEVESWIFDPDGDWFFSFENICEILEIGPQYLRSGLLALREKLLAAHSVEKMDPANSGVAEKGGFESGVSTHSTSLSFESEPEGASLRVEDRLILSVSKDQVSRRL
jgi:hypothetical protein